MPSQSAFTSLIYTAAQALKDKSDEVNRLNVFPVPDGDTGTNMSLTMDAVISELASTPANATIPEICHAVTQGSLMGARGNSGVILSQIIRGICDVVGEADVFDAQLVADALAHSKTVAYQAVRKPVEGTILTVLKDSAAAATEEVAAGTELDELLHRVVKASFDSVRHTPELLPVLKENGVVDAGGYGLAILAEGLLAAYEGHEVGDIDVKPVTLGAPLAVLPEDDWDDQEYLYCTEFLLFGDDLNHDEIEKFISSRGGSELVVGSPTTLKIHVHTNDPGEVLSHMTTLGEVGEVHIHNMRKQTRDRSAALLEVAVPDAPAAKYGFVSVAAGNGLREILESLGVNIVVSGGQTMNPSTAELAEAGKSIAADHVIILPNNKNIIMAAQQAAEVADGNVHVVPTKAVPEAFAALLAFDEEEDPEINVTAMTDAAAAVRTGEVTTAIKDSKGKVGDIRQGQIIGIADHEIEVTGDEVADVTLRLAAMLAQDAGVLTVLAGEDLDDTALEDIVAALQSAHPDVEVDAHRGEQPLYPVILAAE